MLFLIWSSSSWDNFYIMYFENHSLNAVQPQKFQISRVFVCAPMQLNYKTHIQYFILINFIIASHFTVCFCHEINSVKNYWSTNIHSQQTFMYYLKQRPFYLITTYKFEICTYIFIIIPKWKNYTIKSYKTLPLSILIYILKYIHCIIIQVCQNCSNPFFRILIILTL
jgi:hypothetical protein